MQHTRTHRQQASQTRDRALGLALDALRRAPTDDLTDLEADLRVYCLDAADEGLPPTAPAVAFITRVADSILAELDGRSAAIISDEHAERLHAMPAPPPRLAPFPSAS